MAERTVEYRIRAVDEASAVFDKAGRNAARLGGGEGGAHGILGGLKGAFGRGSTFKEGLEILEGGGVIAGLTIAAHLLAEGAKEAAELRKQFHEGTIDAGTLAEKLVGTLPIIGQFWQAGRAIRELFTGDAEEVERIKAEAEAVNRALDVQRDILKHTEDSHQHSLETIRQIRNEIELIGLTGTQHGLLSAAQAAAVAVDAAEKEFERKRAEARAKGNAGIFGSAGGLSLGARARQAEEEAEAVRRRLASHEASTSDDPGTWAAIAGREGLQKELREREAAAANFAAQIKHIRDAENADVAKAEADKNATVAAVQERGELQSADIQNKAAEEQLKQSRENAQRLADVESEARQARLQAIGREADAEAEAIRRAADRDLAAVDEKEKAKTLSVEEAESQRLAIRRRFEDEDAKLTADAGEKVRKDAERLRDDMVRDVRRFGEKKRKQAQDEHERMTPKLAQMDETRGSGAAARLISDLEARTQPTEDKVPPLLEKLPKGIADLLLPALQALQRAIERGGTAGSTRVYSGGR